MKTEPQITYKGLDSSPTVENAIRKRIDRLDQIHNRITSCRVTIELPHRHGRKGKIFHVHVDITVPGAEIVAGREHENNHAHEDVLVAVRDSFNAAQRQLEDVVRKMSGHLVKPEPVKLHGIVARLVPEEGFGFIQTVDGREFFFRRDSMASNDHWNELQPGTEVRFTEHTGDKGPFASAVSPV
ncbi:HPF/RaiA family ribosome-associated protein [Stappia sp. GBMRC 2046]|uniref:HPF/RaiA family ribosome-associated protein n=1 Tax=Stappia sediminis TaxID=2692190 RepID=A0A7X3S708_9HYPH|nr:HPF/RaiA family ribosome-associated protein [Stappia sediminis]MXN64348.1 HPF/RaiA family ribosome-associated protein [Stappia sediminis]